MEKELKNSIMEAHTINEFDKNLLITARSIKQAEWRVKLKNHTKYSSIETF